jgi:hypothetical protein
MESTGRVFAKQGYRYRCISSQAVIALRYGTPGPLEETGLTKRAPNMRINAPPISTQTQQLLTPFKANVFVGYTIVFGLNLVFRYF